MPATVRRPIGADDRWKPGDKKRRARLEEDRRAAWEALPAEEKRRRRAEMEIAEADHIQWRKDFDEFGPDEARRRQEQRRADRAAQAAAEGNADNSEGSADASRS